MFRTTHTRGRLALGIALASALVVIAAPQALAGSGYQDGWYGYAVALTKAATSSPVLDGRSPDTRDAALAAGSQSATIVDGRSPDTRDFAGVAHSPVVTATRSGYQDGWYGYAVALTKAATSSQVLDGRSPDTRDFAGLAHTPVVTITRSPGFDWGDFGIGVAAALGLVLLLAVSVKTRMTRNHQPNPVATA